MKAPSRTLPPKAAPQNGPSMLSGIVLTLFIGAAGWSAVVSLPFRWVAGTSLVVCVLIAAYDRARLKRLRHEHRADSICTFARALPARHHDTWVVRAVYEELSDSARAPLRPSDDLEKFWGVLDEDLDDAIIRIAQRAGRSVEDASGNPYRGKVTTVAGVIAFLEHQPEAQPRPVA